MELSDEAYRKLMLEIAEARGKSRRRFSASGCVVWALSLIMFVVFMAALLPKLAETYPLPVLSHLFVTPQAVFGTPQAAPGALAAQDQQQGPQQQLTPFYTAPEAAPVFAGEPAAPEPTAAPYTTKANLAPSSPEDNPGFNCGVEPGADPHATCEDTKPDAADPEQEPNVYSVTDRVFSPAVLPTSGPKENPGFDASVEPGSEPTPIQ